MCFYIYDNLLCSFPRLLFRASLSTHRVLHGLHDPSSDCWVCYETNCNSEPGFPSHLAAKMNCCWLNDHWFSWKQSYASSNSQLCHHLWGFVAWALRHLAEIFTQSRIALTEALRSHLESRLSDSMGWPSSVQTAHVLLVLSHCLFIALLVYLFAVGASVSSSQTFFSWLLLSQSFSEERQWLKETGWNQMGWVVEKRLCCGKALITPLQ